MPPDLTAEAIGYSARRAYAAMRVGFDPDRLPVSDTRLRRRMAKVIGRRTDLTREQRRALEQLIRVNESDLCLAAAIELGLIDEQAKEAAHQVLDERLSRITETLPGTSFSDLMAGTMEPVWLDGDLVHWWRTGAPSSSFVRHRSPSRRHVRLSTRRRVRCSTRGAPGRPGRQDDDPEPVARLGGPAVVHEVQR